MSARENAKLFSGTLSPVYFHNHAQAFLDAATREFAAADHISIPGYFLAGRAAELALKSYLLAKGASEADLRRINHDLAVAMLAAADLKVSEKTQAVLTRLNPYYSGKDLEYPKSGFKSFPAHEDVLSGIRDLLECVAPVVWSWVPGKVQ